MDRFSERLKASMLARGMCATPENLAKACSGLLTLEEAKMLLEIKSLPPIFRAIAIVCRGLQVRMIWVTSGQTIPQPTGLMTRDDVEVLELLESLNPEERGRWIARGKRLLKR